MNTTIVITDNIQLVFSKHLSSNTGTYSPRVFRKGGEASINPRTREAVITEDKWVDVPLYFTNLKHALRWCAQEALHTGETFPIETCIERLSGIWKDSPSL